MGLDRPRPRAIGIPRPGIPGALAPRLSARRRARGRGRGAVPRRTGTAPESRGHRGERSVHGHLRRLLGAIRRLRRPGVRVLARPLGALLARRHHRRGRHRARTVPGRGAGDDGGDLAARRARRAGLQPDRHVPDPLWRCPDPDGALRPAGHRRLGAAAMSLLSVHGVTKTFGGISANRGITFDVASGELVGIIGPNGAGKSTLFECISGFYAPDAGDIELDGARLNRLSPDRVCRLGVARTFQKLRPFSGMTVVENVMVGALTRTKNVKHAREQAHEWLRRVGLVEKANAHARTLSTGQRKRLEMARALATQPRVVLLDEVTGGVDQRSIPGLVELVRELHAGGLTVLLIEHNMRVVTAVAKRILALHMGELIADGPPELVARDRRVVEAYLGQAYVA